MKPMIENMTLYNGVAMPQEGFGVFQVPEYECKEVVLNAIRTGYRLIDTASSYKNEEAVGAAIREAAAEGAVKRDNLFIVTKADLCRRAEGNVHGACFEGNRCKAWKNCRTGHSALECPAGGGDYSKICP